MKKALITGITGQDGSYLAEFLLDKGYDVFGLVRRSSTFNTDRIDHLYKDPHDRGVRLRLIYGDLNDASSLNQLVRQVQPDEIYNLGAQSHVRVSFDIPEYTSEVSGLGAVRLLEAIRETGLNCRYYQASSSELFGSAPAPQSETTPFHPRSPYACAKAYAYYITVNYREAYKIHASNGILFNHESPRRGATFVTRKVTRAAAHIKLGLQDKLFMGNLDAKRDWGFAGDYVEGMWQMLQQDEPDDYVLATGETHTVRSFVEKAFAVVEREIEWTGRGVEEKGRDARTGELLIEIDPRYFRPNEVDFLLGDATKASTRLGWQHTISFDELVTEMVETDLRTIMREVGRNDRYGS